MAEVTVKKSYKNFKELAPITEDITINNKSGYVLQICIVDEVNKGSAISKEIVSDKDGGLFATHGGAGLIFIGVGETKTFSTNDLDSSFKGKYPNAKWALLNREDQLKETMEIEIV